MDAGTSAPILMLFVLEHINRQSTNKKHIHYIASNTFYKRVKIKNLKQIGVEVIIWNKMMYVVELEIFI
ncbi:hypothetical protein CL176_02330 [Suicoccus acidiformans]|uniref:Uncharacterized protein n=1 Tax=Suicoccus acidiformans TaxID=2036206 RepID=A0A347WIP8_9LACT|nr:hypothetical protein CL176_02330 [Suicoccus acidiformans]